MIVVTGAGFVGGQIIATLARDRAVDIIVVDDDLTPAKRANFAAAPIAAQLTPVDLLRAADTDRAFARRVDAVIHMGARTDTWEQDAELVLASNYGYSTRLLDWCLRSRIPLVYASSAAVYNGGSSPYARSKLLLDRAVAAILPTTRSPVIGLRLVNVYGPGEAHKGRMASVVFQFFRQLRDTGSVDIYADPSLGAPGSQRRDLLHVDDVVATTLWFVEHGRSGIYDVGTGEPTSFNDLACLVLAHAGPGTVRYTPLPAHLRGSYQTYTRADLGPLRAAGYDGTFRLPRVGVPRYLEHLAAHEATATEERQGGVVRLLRCVEQVE